MSEERHIIALWLGGDMLDIFFREGATFRCMAGVPRDAQCLGVHADFHTFGIVVHFEHPSFPVCAPGAEPERRFVSYEVLEHPHARDYEFVPVKFGAGEHEVMDMRKWIVERAAQIEGRAL